MYTVVNDRNRRYIGGKEKTNVKRKSGAVRGFTLVEMIIAVGLFAIVMLVCVGALLALVGANRKVQALQSVMNNLNVTLDGMSRNIRMGSTFDGSVSCVSNSIPSHPKDCDGGGSQFSFQPYGNGPSGYPWIYAYDADGSICGAKAICRKQNNGSFQRVTSPEVTIESMSFFVVGTAKGCSVNPCDLTQPKVVIEVKGTAPVINSAARSSFHVQVTAVQRVLDL